MKRVHQEYKEVPQRVADSMTSLVAEHLRAAGVARAMDLPEERKIALLRAIQEHKQQNMPDGLKENKEFTDHPFRTFVWLGGWLLDRLDRSFMRMMDMLFQSRRGR